MKLGGDFHIRATGGVSPKGTVFLREDTLDCRKINSLELNLKANVRSANTYWSLLG